jgi:uncharacterized membrane protein SpoIIM required for sporulation
MNLDGWLQERRPVWKRLEAIVDHLIRRGPRRIATKEITDLVEFYQSACADLARLRAMGAEPDLVDPLNRLIIRAHGQVYRGEPASPWSLGAFFFRDYPRLFRRTWKFTLASFLVSLVTACAAFWTVQDSPQTVADIMGGSDREYYGEKSVADIRERFGHQGNPLLSSFVITNNIRVALTAFALGISFGLGTIWVLAANGSMVGGIAGAFAKSGIQREMWMVLLPHGALELSAIVIAGGAGLIVGYGLWAPGQRTRLRALREDVVRAMQLAVGLVPAFAIAGLFEGLVTPSDAIAQEIKVALGITVAVLFWLYLLLAGRGATRPSVARSGSLRDNETVSKLCKTA